MKLNIQIRKVIYQQALSQIEDQEFMCNAIRWAASNTNRDSIDHFPEFYLFKPSNRGFGSCWFNDYKMYKKNNVAYTSEYKRILNTRRFILELCILMCEENE